MTNTIDKFKDANYNSVVAFKNEAEQQKFTNNMLDLALQVKDLSKLPEPLALAKDVYALTKRGISLDASLNHVWLVPFKNTYNFIISVKGLIAQANYLLKNQVYRIENYGYRMIPKEATKLNARNGSLELLENDALQKHFETYGFLPYDANGKLVDTGYLYTFIEITDGLNEPRYVCDIFFTRDLKMHGLKYTASDYTNPSGMWQKHAFEMMGKTALKKVINNKLIPVVRNITGAKIAEVLEDEVVMEQGVEVQHDSGKTVFEGLKEQENEPQF